MVPPNLKKQDFTRVCIIVHNLFRLAAQVPPLKADAMLVKRAQAWANFLSIRQVFLDRKLFHGPTRKLLAFYFSKTLFKKLNSLNGHDRELQSLLAYLIELTQNG